MRLPLAALLILGALIAPSSAAAQAVGSTAPFTLSIAPQYATPGGQLTLEPLSSTLNLANATFTVTVNGKEVYSGNAGAARITVGPAGAATTIKATIATAGKTYTQNVSIVPQDVSLIIEPLASAPVSYQGKPPIPLEGGVRLVALANFRTGAGKAIDPSTLSYSWSIDGQQDARLSGIGKSVATVASPLEYRRREVSVTVTNGDQTLTSGTNLSFTAQQPVVRIYENDPLLGIRFESALADSYEIRGTEAVLYAGVFGLPITDALPSLNWFLNGSAAQSGSLITLRPTGNGKGSASLSFTAKGGNYTSSARALTITFGSSSGSGLFGI